jgi:hypothetical protein
LALAPLSFLLICAQPHINKYVAFLDMWRRIALMRLRSEFDHSYATYLRDYRDRRNAMTSGRFDHPPWVSFDPACANVASASSFVARSVSA